MDNLSYTVKSKEKKSDGQLIWLQKSMSPIKDEHGATIYASVVIEDISNEKQESDRVFLF